MDEFLFVLNNVQQGEFNFLYTSNTSTKIDPNDQHTSNKFIFNVF